MAYQLRDRRFTRVGVVGAGNLGPGVALHLAEVFGVHDVPVVVVDTSERALASAEQRIRLILDQRVASGSLSGASAQHIQRSLSFTTMADQLQGASLVVEAVSEDLPVKRELLSQIEQLIRNEAILLSTSAHFEPRELFAGLRRPRQAVVARYNYPADRNLTVELVAGPETSSVLMGFVELLYEQSGRAPIRVGSRFGHALSPIVDGLLLTACTVVQRGWATVDQVDAAFRTVLGHPTGIFEGFDLSGGTRGAAVGLSHYGLRVGPWYHLPDLLRHKALSAEPWRDGAMEPAGALHGPAAGEVADYLLGAYFALACEVLDAQLVDLADLQEALELGLGMRSAFALMNERGPAKSLGLVERFASANSGMPVSPRLRQLAAADQVWPVSRVRSTVEDEVAVLTIRRMKQQNRIDASLLVELEAWLRQLEGDDQVRAVVIRGFGIEAFVAGTEVEELVTLRSPGQAMEWSRRGQRVTSLIDQMCKPVVAALNGRAVGPGSEIALACHARVGVRGLDMLLAQPEPRLGMIPAYGATQRLPRLIGLAGAWPLLRTGEPISSTNALELGLLSDCVPVGDLTDRAVELAGQIASGRVEAKRLPWGPIDVPQTLPEVDVSNLSRPVDELLQQAMLRGAEVTLQEGLEIETQLFGKCAQTEDFHRGVANHVNNGPDVAAEFVHR